MSFIAARCTQCGAEIEVDDTKEAGICKYCGTSFITEKVINNYNTYVTNNEVHNYAGATINITSPDNPEYLCPQCHSSETRAVKLNTIPPKNISYKNVTNWCEIFFLFFALGTVLSITVEKSLFNFVCGVIFTAGTFKLLQYYKQKQKEANVINERNMYEWNHTYQCLRCGKNFIVNNDTNQSV